MRNTGGAKRMICCASALLALSVSAAADDHKDAVVAQTAAALASADFAKRHCPNIRIDDALIAENAAEAEVTVEALRADESYTDQAAAVASVEKENGSVMVCMLLPSAHNGLARGILTRK